MRLREIDAAVRVEGLARTLAAIDAHGMPAARVFVALWRAEHFLGGADAARVAGFRCRSSFQSAVRRAGLPGWCALRSAAMAVRVASLLEVPACSIETAAGVVGASSAQYLCRFVRRLRGVQASAWRRTATGAGELDALVRDHVAAHRDAWRAMGPESRDAAVTPTLLRTTRGVA